MANLTEVQMALKQGDKAKATQLLKVILQKNPSADAWVMAARMTSNPENANAPANEYVMNCGSFNTST